MANVLASLIQASQQNRAAESQAAQGIGEKIQAREMNKIGKKFIMSGDFSPNGLQQFARQNGLNQNQMMQVVEVANKFQEFKDSAAPAPRKTFRAETIGPSGAKQLGIYDEGGQPIANVGKTGFSPEEKAQQAAEQAVGIQSKTHQGKIDLSLGKQKALAKGKEDEILFRAKQTAKALADNPPTSLTDVMDAEMKLRKEFQARKGVKAYEILKPQVSRIDSLMADVSSGKTTNFVATDQALITIYNKMLDENSVVRESEYARTAENTSLLNRIKGTLSKQVSGGAGLAAADRESIYNAIKQFDAIANSDYNDKVNYYQTLAGQYKLSPDRIVQSDFGDSGGATIDTSGGGGGTGDAKVDDFLKDYYK